MRCRLQTIGKNIKMLMPPDIAVNHDSYVRAYMETGVKHIVGRAREVPVVTKSGETLTCV